MIKKIVKLSKIIVIAGALLAATGCVKTAKLSGYNPETDKFDALVPGKTRKAIVERELGSPSAVATYGDTWYYISTERESIAFLKPKIKSQRVVEITFNEDQTIQKVTRYNEKDAQRIKVTKDVTRTEGHDTGVLGQLLGNVGRFNTDRRDVTAPKGNGP